MSITLDYLPKNKELKIYQDDQMIRINTDTMVLGEFLEVYKKDTVLDIGTDNGALLLYANMFKPKKLIGLDINEDALKIAKMNMELHNITNYELICDNAVTYRGELVDVIICNPPYFKTKEEDKCDNPYLSLAKHEGDLILENLITTIDKNIKTGGTLFFLFQTSRLNEVLLELNKHKFNVKIMKFVYDKNKEYSNVFLIKAIKGGLPGMVVEKPIIIER